MILLIITVCCALSNTGFVEGASQSQNDSCWCSSAVGAIKTDMATEVTAIISPEFQGQKLTDATAKLLDIIHRNINVNTKGLNPQYPRDCNDALARASQKTGVYSIRPDRANKNYTVYCEATSEGVYTYIQQRVDDSVHFDRTWNDYKNGFGTVEANKNFYVGNELIHLLTEQNQYSLRIDLTSFSNEARYAKYLKFSIDDEANKYRLHVESHSGTAVDKLSYHNQSKFSTLDSDNDIYTNNCAQQFGGGGGWWYKICFYSNLNGKYYDVDKGVKVVKTSGVNWEGVEGKNSEKRASMKIIRNLNI